MWSASSRIVTSIAPRSQCPCWIRSSSRPGQAMTTSRPPASAETCGFWPTPPKIVVVFMPSARASGSTTAATWLASSRVGTRISERGRLGWRLLVDAARRATSGRLNARVLPEPVRPRPSTSLPERLSGSVATWIGNGEVMPLAVSTSTSGAGTPRAAKVVSVGSTVASAPTGTTTGAGTASARPGRGAGGVCWSPAGRPPRPRPPRERRGRLSPVPWRTWGSCWVKSSVPQRSSGRRPPRRARAQARLHIRAGRAHIVSETSDSRAHQGGAASARRRFLPLRMSERAAPVCPTQPDSARSLFRSGGVTGHIG